VKFYFCHQIFFLSVSPGSAGLVRSSVLVRFAPLESFRTTFNLHWSGLPFPIRAARQGLSVLPKAEDLYNFPKAEDLSFHAARRDLSVFPKAEDLFVRVARQDLSIFPKAKDLSVRATRLDLSIFPEAEDLSVFPKAKDLSDFQVWDIGQVPMSNFDRLPITPPSGRLLRSFIQCISFLLFPLLTLDERQISYSRSK
jgi:hypothetical protein